MIRTDQLSSVEGGDMISYDVIITHGIMSRVDASELVILIPLSDCELVNRPNQDILIADWLLTSNVT